MVYAHLDTHLNCEQFLFFFRFSEGSARRHELLSCCLMSHIRCLLFDFRRQMSYVLGQMSDVTRLISGVFCLLSDVRCLMFVLRHLMSDVYFLIADT